MADRSLPSSPPSAAEPSVAGVSDSVDATGRIALGVLALLAVYAIVTVARPVGVGILLGTLAAFAFEPMYESMVRRTKRPHASALACVALALIGCTSILGGIGSLLIARGTVLVSQLIVSVEPGGALRGAAERLVQDFGLQTQTQAVVDKLRSAVTDIASRAAGIAAVIATGSFTMLLMLFFLLLALYFVLIRGRALEEAAVVALPLQPKHSLAMFEELHMVGRTALVGTIVTGIAQGVLAGLGFWACGLPEPAFFGALTAIASLIPGVGTLLIWVPAGLYLILTGHSIGGVMELVWGAAAVVGLSDYVVRPMLVGGHGDMPALLTFAALFGGVEAFGLIGLIMGPLLMSLAVAFLRIYVREMRARRVRPAA
ncbi:MAG: putative rane protein [Myxococcaceae bacterium]|nr:putative rane protein [Myxococcaceae bacterium]